MRRRTEALCGKPCRQHAAERGDAGGEGFFRLPADEPDGEREDDGRRDDCGENRRDAVHEQWEEKEEEAREGQNEREHGFQPLAAADEDEQRAKKTRKQMTDFVRS